MLADLGWSKFDELEFCCTALLFGFGGVRNIGLGAFFCPGSLGERVLLGSDCSRPTETGILENRGLSACPLKVKRGDFGAECSCAFGKSMRGRPDISRIAPQNLGALQGVGQKALWEVGLNALQEVEQNALQEVKLGAL